MFHLKSKGSFITQDMLPCFSAWICGNFHQSVLVFKKKALKVPLFCYLGDIDILEYLDDMAKYYLLNKEGKKLCVCIFTNPSAQAGYDTRSIFKWSLTGLNSEFFFS